jgi:hypothetical protein
LLSLKKKITVRDIKTFLPFSINLDPYIKKVIKDEYQLHEEVLNQGHAAPLTQRQAAGLSRKLSTDPASKGAAAAALAGISPNQVMAPAFHNYGTYPHMPPWPPFQPSAAFGFDSRGSSPPGANVIKPVFRHRRRANIS